MNINRPLGKNQRSVLESLVQHRGWDGGRWVWTNESTTLRILDSLVRRGLAEKVGSHYRPTETGRGEVPWADPDLPQRTDSEPQNLNSTLNPSDDEERGQCRTCGVEVGQNDGSLFINDEGQIYCADHYKENA